MAATTLEARLRWRLIAVQAPALTALALAAVLVTARALESTDDERARAVATAVARSLVIELAEGDAPEHAEREAVAAIDSNEERVAVNGRMSRSGPLPGAPPLDVGECTSAQEVGASWRVCRIAHDGVTVTAAVRTDAHRAVLRCVSEWMAAAVLLALVAAVLASRVALKGTLRALRDLADWATRTTDGTRAAAPCDDTIEINQLARRFDALVGDLVDALARERASSAYIAHELRTPLTAIVAELDRLTPGPARDRMRSDVERLERVIDAILVLSGPSTTRGSGTIVNVADLARKLAPRGTPVEAPDEALVEAEPELVELAIHNLVENAGKYAPGGPSVVRVLRETDHVRVAVIDEGPGVAPSDREHMFDRYWRDCADGAGRGIGLALVRAVAERSGGHAEARDGRNGMGLEVGFSLGPLLVWSEP